MTDEPYAPSKVVMTIGDMKITDFTQPITIIKPEEITDAKRYQWLKQQVTEVLCEGRPTDCYSKYMLPRLTCEDSTGRRYTFDEIIVSCSARAQVMNGNM